MKTKNTNKHKYITKKKLVKKDKKNLAKAEFAKVAVLRGERKRTKINEVFFFLLFFLRSAEEIFYFFLRTGAPQMFIFTEIYHRI